MDPNIYAYAHNGCTYYGQGFDESEVRIALETKLSLDHGTLTAPRILGKQDVLRISKGPSVEYIVPFLALKRDLPLEEIANSTIGRIKALSRLTREQVAEVLRVRLSIPQEFYSTVHDGQLMSSLLALSTQRIAVKTHRYLPKESIKERFIDPASGRVLYIEVGRRSTGAVSRVEEMRRLIKNIVSMDFNSVVDYVSREENLERELASLQNAKDKRYKYGHLMSNDEYTKIESKIQSLERTIPEIQNEIRIYNDRYHSTGYYVNTKDEYLFSTYEEYRRVMNSIYQNTRIKLMRYCFQDIPYNDDFSMLEYLDSFMLNESDKNRYLCFD